MKRFISVLISILFFASCSEKMDKASDDEVIAIRLKVGGELIESQQPLSKTPSSALYGIQIYTSGNEKVAYGVFDNLTDAVIMLSKTKQYDIEMSYIPNGKDVIHYHSSNDCWELPFNTFGWGASPLNQFVYSKNEYIYGLGGGSNTPAGDGNDRRRCIHNEVDRYYGFYKNYTPTEDGTITVDMKRTVFGLTFKAKKVENNDYEKIFIQLDADKTLSQLPKNYYITVDSNADVSTLTIPFICVQDVSNAANNANYSEEIVISIGTDEKPGDIFYGTINVKRNTMHIYEFEAKSEDSISNGLNINLDETPMNDETTNL